MNQRIAIVSVLLLIATIGRAQTTNASIYGSILDSSGAAVPRANVTANNVKTGVALSTVSNDSGIYIFPSLLPGEYTVSAELTGFRKAVASGIQLDVSSRISVDLKLEVGTAAETVTV
ncbi:MAG TPA: carboxypeptidase-like regulatory domain-containing protein, partial [Bryobacteraceae bacterium]